MKLFFFIKKCTCRESNPGLIRGRDTSYHWTTSAYILLLPYPDPVPMLTSLYWILKNYWMDTYSIPTPYLQDAYKMPTRCLQDACVYNCSYLYYRYPVRYCDGCAPFLLFSHKNALAGNRTRVSSVAGIRHTIGPQVLTLL